jgi:uncharacterized protein YciI
MRRSVLALLMGACLIVAAGSAAQVKDNSQEPPKKPAGPERYQLVLLKLGPVWQKGTPLAQQPGIQEHAAYMLKLIKQGTLVLGGPLLDDKLQIFTGAMMVLAASTPEDAQRILAADPATTSGLFQIDKIETMIITGTSWRRAVE